MQKQSQHAADIKTQIELALPTINQYPQYGTIEFVDHEQVGETFGPLQDDDLVVYYDFMDDECESQDEVDNLAGWYHDELPQQLVVLLDRFGYRFLSDMDGSGGGLYYGAIVFRKTS